MSEEAARRCSVGEMPILRAEFIRSFTDGAFLSVARRAH